MSPWRFGSLAALALFASPVIAESWPLYIGTGQSGIYRADFDPDSGALSKPVLVGETKRPTFLALHPSGETLYSISELYRERDPDGPAVLAWSIGPQGELTRQSRRDALGDGPCYVTVDDQGRYAAIANYGGGSVSLFPIAEDGSLGEASGHVQHRGSSVNPRRQMEAHAHAIRFDPGGRRVVAADLGTDRVYLYDVGSGGTLSPADPPEIAMPPGSGPRHLVFSPDGRYLLVLGELTGTITRVRYAPPEVEVLGTVSTMAEGTPDDAPRGSAEILFHPGGRFVYASNRGPSEIAVFRFDPDSGGLQRVFAASTGGRTPRNFRFAPDGRFLLAANQNSDSIVVFRVDNETGRFEPTGTEVSVPQPMCLKFLRPQR